jgi:serine protease inhibitor
MTKRYGIRLLGLSTSFLFAACAEKKPIEPGPGNPGQPIIEQPRALTANEQLVATSNTSFGLALLNKVHASEAGPNFLISPLSASMALGMTMNGAVGTTFDAMRTTLGFGTLPEADVNAAYRGLIAQLRARDPKVEFGLANSLWHETTFPVHAAFSGAVRDNFDAQVTALDFGAASAPKTISDWASDKTGGRIKNLIEKIDPLEKLFLVNAVYFKAPWTAPFVPEATRPGTFRRLNGTDVSVPLMTRDGAFRHLMNSDVHAVELFYADSAYSMVLIMPAAAATPLTRIAEMLTAERWGTLLSQFTNGRVMLTMPKFRFDYSTKLNEPLKDLGMRIAFVPRSADFTRIANRDDLYITQVLQKSFIDVHELGTEAASATAVGVGVTSLPPQMQFTRPFFFAIRERSSGALLFIGRIGDPSAP